MKDREAMQLLFYGILISLLRQEKPEIELERGIESEKRDVNLYPMQLFQKIYWKVFFISHDYSLHFCNY